ncbi:MAG: 1,2-diacylglycerol 3-alpha-glucosyltransferase [Thermoleophilaceae bacterium]|nr:1,2-diacylglycerol 3-alpha-glucosyltransferase [Thermoleophilaceae bacterium]
MKVLLSCAGLDHARRGFESFARACFEALRDDPALELELVKGSGPRGPSERSVPTLSRDSRTARLVARASGREPFIVEHAAHGLALVPLVRARRPDVVYLSEWHVGRVLAGWRRASGQRFAIVLNNGSSSTPPYDHFDLVQHLTPGAYEWAVDRGADPERSAVLPYGFDIRAELDRPWGDDRRALRERLGLPADRRIVISVAALNRQKRIDYLVEEVAALPEPRPFLLLLGQVEEETPPLRALAEERLGADGHDVRTVAQSDVRQFLDASDVFVLCSLWEALPLALVEAMGRGLPAIAHRHPVMLYALGDRGRAGDLERPGELRELLAAIGDDELAPERAAERHRSTYEQFSWDVLRPQYVELFRRAAALPHRHRVHRHPEQ